MSTFLKTLISFIFLSVFFSCSKDSDKNKDAVKKDTIKNYTIPVYNNYLNDTNISDQAGKPKYLKRKNRLLNSGIRPYSMEEDKPKKVKLEPVVTAAEYYLPFNIRKKDTIISAGIDSSDNERFTSNLDINELPVLSNYYLGKDIIRLYFEPSFGRDYIITITNDKGKINLAGFTGNSSGETVKLPDKELSADKWDSLLIILHYENFWNATSRSNEDTVDAALSVIEVHFKDSYWYVMNSRGMSKIFDYIILNLAEQKY